MPSVPTCDAGTRTRVIALAFALAVLTLLSRAPAAADGPAADGPGDWPQWRGPDRSNVCGETGLLQEWPPDGPPRLWTVSGLGGGFAPVSVQGRQVYTLGRREDREVAVALDRDNGTEVWAAPLWPAARDHTAMPWLNQRQPTADGARVYVTSADGDLACLDSATGKEQWRKNYRDDFKGKRSGWGYCDYPLVDGDRLIVVPGGPDASVVALDKATGDVVWKCPGAGGTPSHSSLAVAEVGGVRQYVYHFMDGLAGVAAADGKLLWRGVFPARTATVYTPIVRGDQVFCAASYGVGCTLVRLVPPSTAGDGWRTETLYARPEQFVTWQGSTILVGDHVYAGVSQKALACFDFATGEAAWRQGAGEAFGAGQVATLWADGRLYCRYSDGTVALVAATPKGCEAKGRFTIPAPAKMPANPPPVIAGGRLYVRDQDVLHCYDVTRDRRWRHLATTRPVALPSSLPTTRPADPADPADPAATPAGPRSEGPTRPKRPGDPDAVFVPTPDDVVRQMLLLAGVGRADVVYDLGSGDGRVVIAAAKDFGARGVGVEIDPDLVAASRENARAGGVADRVSIRRGDLFDADVGDATVVTLYLLPDVNARLLPKLRLLRPGTRIVSHQFPIAGVRPARVVKYTPDGEVQEHTLYMWVTPLEDGQP